MRTFLTLFVILSLLAPASGAVAQDWEDIAEEVEEATDVLAEFMEVPEESIPRDLLRAAECLAVVPKVIKAGLGFGGRRGSGLMTCRSGGGWTPPVFVKLTGGSFGLQIGVQSTDIVLVFVNRGAARRVLDDQFTFGGQASVAAGPVGRTAEAGTDITFESEIYTYSRSKGVFGGLSIEGAKFGVDEEWVREVYGDVTAEDLLFDGGVRTPDTLVPFLEAVRRHAPVPE